MEEKPAAPESDQPLADHERLALVELLNRVLDRGVVIRGEAVISVAEVDLLYLGLDVVLSSVETARESRSAHLSGP